MAPLTVPVEDGEQAVVAGQGGPHPQPPELPPGGQGLLPAVPPGAQRVEGVHHRRQGGGVRTQTLRGHLTQQTLGGGASDLTIRIPTDMVISALSEVGF